MNATVRHINAVPFSLAGKGTVLRFRTIDLVHLESVYGENFGEVISRMLNNGSSTCMVQCLKLGLKHPDGRKPFDRIDFDDLPFSVVEARDSIFDAITMALTGKSFATLLDARKEAGEGDEPGPFEGSEKTESSAEPSEPPMARESAETTPTN